MLSGVEATINVKSSPSLRSGLLCRTLCDWGERADPFACFEEEWGLGETKVFAICT